MLSKIDSELLSFGGAMLGVFSTILVAAAKIIARQFEQRLEERFRQLQASRDDEAKSLLQLERQFMEARADLPMRYVMRDDYIRGQSLVEAKLDGLATKIDNIQLHAALSNKGGQ